MHMYPDSKYENLLIEVVLPGVEKKDISFKLDEDSFYLVANKESAKYVASYSTCCHVDPKKAVAKELERNNLRNAFFNSNEIMEQRVESFKYSVKIESSYFAAGTKYENGVLKVTVPYLEPLDNLVTVKIE